MKHFDRFLYFCRLQLVTGDYDAHIPLLKLLTRSRGLSPEESIWIGFLYMAYYSEGSAWVAFNRPGVRRRANPPPADLPITTQRRNLYGGRIVRHFTDLYAVKPSLAGWLAECSSWSALLGHLQTLYGNGRWASYTTGELLTHLGGPQVEPSTFEIMDSSGPKQGLVALGLPPTEDGARTVRAALSAAGLNLQMSVLESLLCDWAGMNKGTFYAGRNIDRQQGRILEVERRTGMTCTALWVGRQIVYPAETLGELNGWEGIDRQRLKHYQRTGEVLKPEEKR